MNKAIILVGSAVVAAGIGAVALIKINKMLKEYDETTEALKETIDLIEVKLDPDSPLAKHFGTNEEEKEEEPEE